MFARVLFIQTASSFVGSVFAAKSRAGFRFVSERMDQDLQKV